MFKVNSYLVSCFSDGMVVAPCSLDYVPEQHQGFFCYRPIFTGPGHYLMAVTDRQGTTALFNLGHINFVDDFEFAIRQLPKTYGEFDFELLIPGHVYSTIKAPPVPVDGTGFPQLV